MHLESQRARCTSVSASPLGLSGTFQLEAAGAVAAAADRRFSRPSGHPLLQICVCRAGSACPGCFSGGISTSGIAAGAAAQPVATRYVHKQSAVACDLSAFSDRLLVITAQTGIKGIRDGSKMLSGNHSGQLQHAVSRVARLSQAAAQADITVAISLVAGDPAMLIATQCASTSDGCQPRGAACAGGSMGWVALRCS